MADLLVVLVASVDFVLVCVTIDKVDAVDVPAPLVVPVVSVLLVVRVVSSLVVIAVESNVRRADPDNVSDGA